MAGLTRYLAVELNGESINQTARVRPVESHLQIEPSQLANWGIKTDDLPTKRVTPACQRPATCANGDWIDLDSIPGLGWLIDEPGQRLMLTAQDARLIPTQLGGVSPPPEMDASASGLLINYSASVQRDPQNQYGLYSEQRWFSPAGVLRNDGALTIGTQSAHTVRLDTSWTHSEPGRLLSYRLGDTISSALSWMRPVRLAGIQISRDFALRPDLITFPMPALTGSVAVPSAVDLYIDQVRQFSGNAPTGPFVIDAPPALSGAGIASIVTHDAAGRTVVSIQSLYLDARLLAPGLSDFSVDFGRVRRAYGVDSFDYAPGLAWSASGRRGISDDLTLEASHQAGRGTYNLGVGMLAKLAGAGVINLAVTGSFAVKGPQPRREWRSSRQHGGGLQVALGWQKHTAAVALDLQLQHATPHFGDLASAYDAPLPRTSYRASLAAPLPGWPRAGSASISIVGLSDRHYGDTRIASLGLTTRLPYDASLSLSVFHDFTTGGSAGMFASLSVPIGNRFNATTGVGYQRGEPWFETGITRTADYSGGLGWQARTARHGRRQQSVAAANYRGRYADLQTWAIRQGQQQLFELDTSGSVVWMDGALMAGRRIDDAFALVKTDGMANVPVLHENRVIGRTDHGGHFLIPDLIGYQSNHLGIDPLMLPVNTVAQQVQLQLAPNAGAGVLAEFKLTRFDGAQLLLTDAAGQPIRAGTSITYRQTGKQYKVGYDGTVFVDILSDHATFDSYVNALPCVVQLGIRRRSSALPTLGPFVCRPTTG